MEKNRERTGAPFSPQFSRDFFPRRPHYLRGCLPCNRSYCRHATLLPNPSPSPSGFLIVISRTKGERKPSDQLCVSGILLCSGQFCTFTRTQNSLVELRRHQVKFIANLAWDNWKSWLIFSSFNPFPSSPFVTKDDSKLIVSMQWYSLW